MGLTLGRVFGTEVRAHWTWVFVLAAIVVIFGMGMSNGGAVAFSPALAWGSSIATAVLVFASAVAHELAHVWVGRRYGQQVPVVVVQLLGGPYLMQVQPKTAGEEFRIALAGPLTSLLIAVAFGVPTTILALGPFDNAPDGLQAIAVVLALVTVFNVFLGLVNLVPGYPLDGARVLHGVLWQRTGQESAATAAAVRIGRYVGLSLIGAGLIVMLFVDALAGLCLAISGWLVTASGRFLDRQSVVQNLVAGLRVSDAQDTEPTRVPPQLTLDLLASEYLAGQMGAAALVERGSDLLGLIGAAQIRRIPKGIWSRTRTEDAMVPIAAVPRMAGDADLWSALVLLERTGLDGLLVSIGDAGTGLVSRRSAAKLVHERAEQAALEQARRSRFRGR
jgi:Zn-dependent protease